MDHGGLPQHPALLLQTNERGDKPTENYGPTMNDTFPSLAHTVLDRVDDERPMKTAHLTSSANLNEESWMLVRLGVST